MTGNRRFRVVRYGLVVSSFSVTSCQRAPSFDVLGSFFPAWLVCLAAAILLTVLARWMCLRLRIPLAPPILIYPSLTALFTFALWFICFR
jgi:hypothetical protein